MLEYLTVTVLGHALFGSASLQILGRIVEATISTDWGLKASINWASNPKEMTITTSSLDWQRREQQEKWKWVKSDCSLLDEQCDMEGQKCYLYSALHILQGLCQQARGFSNHVENRSYVHSRPLPVRVGRRPHHMPKQFLCGFGHALVHFFLHAYRNHRCRRVRSLGLLQTQTKTKTLSSLGSGTKTRQQQFALCLFPGCRFPKISFHFARSNKINNHRGVGGALCGDLRIGTLSSARILAEFRVWAVAGELSCIFVFLSFPFKDNTNSPKPIAPLIFLRNFPAKYGERRRDCAGC